MQDLLNIARTTLSSKILTHDKDHFAELAVDAVLRLKGSTNLESINIIKKPGGTLRVSKMPQLLAMPSAKDTIEDLSVAAAQKIPLMI